MNRTILTVLLSISGALLTTLIVVLQTAPPPSTKTAVPTGAPHHARQEK